MLQTFIIVLREGVEASLVIAIVLSYLRKTGRADFLPTVYKALAAAITASFAAAWGLGRLGIGEDAFGGWTLLLSAAFVLSMVVWMNRHGKTMKAHIETRLQTAPSQLASPRAQFGIFAFVFLMIFREGVETVLLLLAVRLDTAGVLQWVAALAGAGLAALFGVSFVRGTIRVNLRQFFQMTSVIMMVVVVQLAITGLHELSESGVLPSSESEMALIGPVVKNDIFFFVLILAMAATMMLLEWRKRSAPDTKGLEGAMLRKAVWTARRERTWMVFSCAASCLFILSITAEFIYAREASALSAPTPAVFDRQAIRIPVATVNDGNLHRYTVDDQGVHVRFIVIRKPDGTLATALDACNICGTQGYSQKGAEVLCRNCASNILVATIGTEGGCNPVPLASRVQGATLVIDESAFDRGVRVFRKG
jgi:FTR1 family protein